MPRKRRVLVIGSGGREHAIVRKFLEHHNVDTIWCAPGNGGISLDCDCVPIQPDDFSSLLRFAKENQADLTVVGPEVPLVNGIVDTFQSEGLEIFGPTRRAAQIEGSKSFCSLLLEKWGVPIPRTAVFNDFSYAKDYILDIDGPLVIKADGLCAGKGVVAGKIGEDAVDTAESIMVKEIFGDAGKKILVQEYLEGFECSVTVVTDGRAFAPLPISQDYKRAFDGGIGPNTGGMGAYSPVKKISREIEDEIYSQIVPRTLGALEAEGCRYRGVMYFGLMITKDGPKVLEINSRFGDPETQVILPRLNGDFFDLLFSANHTLEYHSQDTSVVGSEPAVCVVIAARGYPGTYPKGMKITGIEEAEKFSKVSVLHAGTAKDSNGEIATSGGRVLNIIAQGFTFDEARKRVYSAASCIRFDGGEALMHHRDDIALDV